MNYKKFKKIALIYVGAMKVRDFSELAYNYMTTVKNDTRSVQEIENDLFLNTKNQEKLNVELFKDIKQLSNLQKTKKECVNELYNTNSEKKQKHIAYAISEINKCIDKHKMGIENNQYYKQELEEQKKYLLFAYCYKSCIKNGKLDTMELKGLLTDLAEAKLDQGER